MIQEKSTHPKITSPDMMEVCEVIYKYQDYRSPIVMEYYVNDEHEYIIRKHLIEKSQKINGSKINIKRDIIERCNTQIYY